MLHIHSEVLPLTHLLLECQLTLKAAQPCCHCSHDAATVPLPPLLIGAGYVIECYWASPKCCVL